MDNLLTQLAIGAEISSVGGSDKDSNLTGHVETILKNIILILSVVCVAVMIIGGVQYMTSAGDTGKVEKGKMTILYGLIGLIVCALAFIIVNFVIEGILKQPPKCEEGQVYNVELEECVAK